MLGEAFRKQIATEHLCIYVYSRLFFHSLEFITFPLNVHKIRMNVCIASLLSKANYSSESVINLLLQDKFSWKSSWNRCELLSNLLNGVICSFHRQSWCHGIGRDRTSPGNCSPAKPTDFAMFTERGRCRVISLIWREST